MSKSLKDFADQKLDALDAKAQRRHLQNVARSQGMQLTLLETKTYAHTGTPPAQHAATHAGAATKDLSTGADETNGASGSSEASRANGQNTAPQAPTPLISFTDNDYLGLSTDPRVIEAASAATMRYGTGSGASRLVTGNHALFEAFEEDLADFKGCEAALVFGSGFLANAGTIPALTGEGDLILADSLIHASLHAGITLSRAEAVFFPHSDCQWLDAYLTQHRSQYERVLIIVDGVYSMDGDTAPLSGLTAIAARHDAWLMVDDAHGTGTLGGGRGTAHAFGVAADVPLLIGTLSKAFGGYGGFLAANRSVIELMKSRARTFVYTTGLPPGVIAGAHAALKIMRAEPERCDRPLALAQRFTSHLGLAPATSPIVPYILGDEVRALEADAALRRAGFKVAAIRPPTVAAGTSRLRFAFSATHTEADIDRLAGAVSGLGLSPQ